ncbi:MAG: tetratricopeptide repeat protein [Chloroflexota bacterium]
MEGFHTFGQWVKQRRKALGLTQANLAQRVACSKSMINKIESDLRSPAKPTIELLALHLKIHPADYAGFVRLAQPHLLVEPGDSLEESVATAKTLPVPANAHRLPLTPLIGREREVAAACAILQQAGTRLLTLSGPGGVGKTCLALQVAETMKENFPDGVHIVSLASIRNPALVLSSIAQALGLQSIHTIHNQHDDGQLVTYLHEKHALLILDNFEQVLPAARVIAELLAVTRYLKALVTSRAALRVSCEYEFVVSSLASPGAKPGTAPAALAQFPAVQLFVQHAHAAHAGFALTTENAQSVAEICTRLDGLPLALMLAAARCKVLSPEAILKRLKGAMGGALDLLSGRIQDLPARHQAMRQTIDWSYHLLGEHEKALFRRLSVFAGGCTLEAVEEVCIRPKTEWTSLSLPVAPTSSLDLMTTLVDQSLVRKIEDPDGEPRFFMPEILCEYASESLRKHNELETLRYQHAAYFLRLVDSIEPKLHGAEQEACLKRLDADYDNIQNALRWSCTYDVEIALRMAGGLWEFWLTRGYWREGRAWMADILQRARTVPLPRTRAQALDGAGLLAYVQKDQRTANGYLQESLRIFRELGDQHGEAAVLNHLGQNLNISGQLEQATSIFDMSLQLFHALGARWDSAWVLINIGDTSLQQRDDERALQLFSDAQEAFSLIGHKRGMATAIERQAYLALLHHDFSQAKSLYAESLRLFDEIGDRGGCSWVFHRLGMIAAEEGMPEQAGDYLHKSLHLFDELNDRWGFALSLLRLGKVLRDQYHQTEQAAILFGMADAMLAGFREQMSIAEKAFVEETLQKACAQSNPADWARGRALAGKETLAGIVEHGFATG